MLTLRQALKLPCFDKARVIAGDKGLDQVVRRVHVVDFPDARHDWGQGGLLLTAGHGLKENPESQAALIATLVANGLVGLVFSTGPYFASVPGLIREAAESHGFPLIELPPGVEFIAITERLYAEILGDQFALKAQADDIHRRLTRLALEGGDLPAVAETLGRVLERSVLIESPALEVLATSQHGPVDESRRRTVEAGRAPPERAARLLKRGIYTELRERMGPLRVAPIPDLGMTMERVVAPIVVGHEVYGYIWILAGDHSLTELDELAIEKAATVAGLVLLKEQAVREAQQAVGGDILMRLLRPEVELDAFTLEQAHLVGYRFDRPHQAMFVIGRPAAGGTVEQLGGGLNSWLRGAGEWGLVVVREQGIALMIEAKSHAVGQALAQRLISDTSHPAQPLVVGVGQVYPEDRSLRRSYDEALEAADIGRQLGPDSRVVCFWELGLMHWLYRLPPEALPGNPYLGKIRILAEHDRKTNGDMVRTLDAYLEHGGALAEAAAALNIHRNTLLYRLGRAEEITGLDLKEVTQRLNLHVALKAYQLRLG